jgi:hypothetical protein
MARQEDGEKLCQHNALDFVRPLFEHLRREGERSRITAAGGLCAVVVVLFALLRSGLASDLSGGTFVWLSGGGFGPPIANVALSFVREDGSTAFATTSGATGRYSISLAPGRYYVLADILTTRTITAPQASRWWTPIAMEPLISSYESRRSQQC